MDPRNEFFLAQFSTIAGYLHASSGHITGVLIGDMVTIDYNTQTNQRGKFARVKVDIDLEKSIRKCLMMRCSHKFVTLMVRLVIIILCPFKIPEKSASKDDDNVNSDHGCY
ncbi:hypothetical protein NC652_039816 [Populus alba x Populus x berolinensis]|nr:hypothetical protein NC652_039816 [Populus alba x Populus x berolinensis]